MDKLIGMKSTLQHLKMLAFQSDYTNVNINNKIVKLETDISFIESKIKVESIGNVISNLELINQLFSNFFNMVFNGLDIILSSINDKKSSNAYFVFNKIGKYLNEIKILFDNRTFYTQDIQKALDLIYEMKITYKIDNNLNDAFEKEMISELLKDTYNIFDSNKLKLDNIMCEFYDSGRNINKAISSIYHMIVNMEENIQHNKNVMTS